MAPDARYYLLGGRRHRINKSFVQLLLKVVSAGTFLIRGFLALGVSAPRDKKNLARENAQQPKKSVKHRQLQKSHVAVLARSKGDLSTLIDLWVPNSLKMVWNLAPLDRNHVKTDRNSIKANHSKLKRFFLVIHRFCLLFVASPLLLLPSGFQFFLVHFRDWNHVHIVL
eukprot:gnl/Hemi2/25409_TR8552_c0_g1_i1.p1 gnl/Hemi2/25409_TR8552_c0_g1~~gnl/Hemi2/25409_TR8552_c0_g1_i1.p1  ORF type:complete len:181 (+),score=17.68 gnl/Hemi2/25409_TR8552_c0_g1_i1:37-543(+)